MKTNYAYLDQCIEHIRAIDAEDVSNLELTAELGSGTSVATYAAGDLFTVSGELPVAVKVPHDGRSLAPRLHKELAVSGLLIERLPYLLEVVPKFIAEVAIHGTSDHRSLLITEDVTHGDLQDANPVPVPKSIRQDLTHAFVGEKGIMAVFEDKELDGSVFFDVAGEIRILDLTPGPFLWTYERQSADYRRHYGQVAELYKANELTIITNAASTLASTIPAA